MDKSYQLNSSYESQQSLPPKNKQFSPVITQLMRKDREIEIMRDELSQQNYMIDELSQQINYLEQQLRDNEGFKEKYQSLSEEYYQQSKDVPKLKMPIQTTAAKDIMNQFLELENQGKELKEDEKIDSSEFYRFELEQSLNREFDFKEIIDFLLKYSSDMNQKIIRKNNDILLITQQKMEEIIIQLEKKEEEVLFFREKSRVFYELLQCNMDINTLYKKQHQGLRQALKGFWTVNVDQSQQIESIIKFIDSISHNSNSAQFKPLIENLKQSQISNKQAVQSKLEAYICKICQVEGKTAFEKIQRMVIQLDQYQNICKNIQDEKQEIIDELKFYKEKLQEQDSTISEFELVLNQMEINYKEQLNTQQMQLAEINQKNELIMHQEKLLQELKLEEKSEQELIDEKQKAFELEEMLKIVILIIQGYNINSNEYQLNVDINGISIQKKVQIDINPMINSYLHKIQQLVSNLYFSYGKNYHELTQHFINCQLLIKNQLPSYQLQVNINFQSDNCLEYLEKFYQISQCHYIKQERLTTSEKEIYRKYYFFIPRLLGELVENQTSTFIKLLREKAYSTIMCEPITQNKFYS